MGKSIRPRTSRYEKVLSTIAGQIEDGTLAPGDKLPTEREMAESFGVSRHSVRQAVAALVAGGVLFTRQGDGIYVVDGPWHSLQGSVFRILNAASTRLGDILAFRRMLEPQIAAEAAVHITPSEIQRLKSLVHAQTMMAPEDHGTGEDPDAAFHETLAQAARNPVVVEVMALIQHIMAESREPHLQTPGRWESSAAGHREIIAALEQGNADAAKLAMRGHLEKISVSVEAGLSVACAEKGKGMKPFGETEDKGEDS